MSDGSTTSLAQRLASRGERRQQVARRPLQRVVDAPDRALGSRVANRVHSRFDDAAWGRGRKLRSRSDMMFRPYSSVYAWSGDGVSYVRRDKPEQELWDAPSDELAASTRRRVAPSSPSAGERRRGRPSPLQRVRARARQAASDETVELAVRSAWVSRGAASRRLATLAETLPDMAPEQRREALAAALSASGGAMRGVYEDMGQRLSRRPVRPSQRAASRLRQTAGVERAGLRRKKHLHPVGEGALLRAGASRARQSGARRPSARRPASASAAGDDPPAAGDVGQASDEEGRVQAAVMGPEAGLLVDEASFDADMWGADGLGTEQVSSLASLEGPLARAAWRSDVTPEGRMGHAFSREDMAAERATRAGTLQLGQREASRRSRLFGPDMVGFLPGPRPTASAHDEALGSTRTAGDVPESTRLTGPMARAAEAEVTRSASRRAARSEAPRGVTRRARVASPEMIGPQTAETRGLDATAVSGTRQSPASFGPVGLQRTLAKAGGQLEPVAARRLGRAASEVSTAASINDQENRSADAGRTTTTGTSLSATDATVDETPTSSRAHAEPPAVRLANRALAGEPRVDRWGRRLATAHAIPDEGGHRRAEELLQRTSTRRVRRDVETTAVVRPSVRDVAAQSDATDAVGGTASQSAQAPNAGREAPSETAQGTNARAARQRADASQRDETPPVASRDAVSETPSSRLLGRMDSPADEGRSVLGRTYRTERGGLRRQYEHDGSWARTADGDATRPMARSFGLDLAVPRIWSGVEGAARSREGIAGASAADDPSEMPLGAGGVTGSDRTRRARRRRGASRGAKSSSRYAAMRDVPVVGSRALRTMLGAQTSRTHRSAGAAELSLPEMNPELLSELTADMGAASYNRVASAAGADALAGGAAGSNLASQLGTRALARIRATSAVSSLVRVLERSDGVEEVRRLLGDRRVELLGLTQDLGGRASAVGDAVQTMRTLDASEAVTVAPGGRRVSPVDGGGVPAGGGRRPRRASAAGPGASSVDGGEHGGAAAGASGRVMKLAERLRGLVHLAEVDRRADEAQRQVRRAEASADAAPDAAPATEDEGSDISLEELQREVFEAVQRELNAMKDRFEGGSNGDGWW